MINCNVINYDFNSMCEIGQTYDLKKKKKKINSEAYDPSANIFYMSRIRSSSTLYKHYLEMREELDNMRDYS